MVGLYGRYFEYTDLLMTQGLVTEAVRLLDGAKSTTIQPLPVVLSRFGPVRVKDIFGQPEPELGQIFPKFPDPQTEPLLT